MQSALEQEVQLLLANARDWVRRRDRAVLFGALLCCVPFLPVTFVGLAITLVNLLLVWTRRLPRAELPVLVFSLCMTALYAVLWWLLFEYVVESRPWLSIERIWHWLLFLVPTHMNGSIRDV